jgi:hypothetical protein
MDFDIDALSPEEIQKLLEPLASDKQKVVIEYDPKVLRYTVSIPDEDRLKEAGIDVAQFYKYSGKIVESSDYRPFDKKLLKVSAFFLLLHIVVILAYICASVLIL